MVRRIAVLFVAVVSLFQVRGEVEITPEMVESGEIWKLTPETVCKALGTALPVKDSVIETNRVKLFGAKICNSVWHWSLSDMPGWEKEVLNWHRYWAPPADASPEQRAEWGKNISHQRPARIDMEIYYVGGPYAPLKKESEIRAIYQRAIDEWSRILKVEGRSKTRRYKREYSRSLYYEWNATGRTAAVSIWAELTMYYRYNMPKDKEANSSLYNSISICVSIAPSAKRLSSKSAEHPWEENKSRTFRSMLWDGSLWEVSPNVFRKLFQGKDATLWHNYRPDIFEPAKIPEGAGHNNVCVMKNTFRYPYEASLGSVQETYYWSPENSKWAELWEKNSSEAVESTDSMRIKRVSAPLKKFHTKSIPTRSRVRREVDILVKDINTWCGMEAEVKSERKGRRTEVSYTWHLKKSVIRLEMAYDDQSINTEINFAPDEQNLDFQREQPSVGKKQ